MMKEIVPVESIVSKIVFIRGEKVLLDQDLAELYCVETGALNRAVKRNSERFPKDFMFQLSAEEAELLRCQTGISKSGRGGRRYLPYAFTEQGVAMFTPLNACHVECLPCEMRSSFNWCEAYSTGTKPV